MMSILRPTVEEQSHEEQRDEDDTDAVVQSLPASWKQFHWKRRNKTAEVIKEKRRRNKEAGYSVKQHTYEYDAEYDEEGFLVVDGVWFEGGGQIIRNSIAYSSILGKKLKLINVRAKRTTKGLKSQHLAPIQFVASVRGSTFATNDEGPLQINFTPGTERNSVQKSRIDLGNAGSVTLAIQAILPVLLFGSSPFSVEIVGGTNVMSSPDIDWFIAVFLPTLNTYFKTDVEVEVAKRGFYPMGGGRVVLTGDPVPVCLEPIWLDHTGRITHITAMIWSTGQVSQKSRMQCSRALYRKLDRFFRGHPHLIGPPESNAEQQEEMSGYNRRQSELNERKQQRKRRQSVECEDTSEAPHASPLISEHVEFSLEVNQETGVGQGRLGALVVARTESGGCLGSTALGGKGVTPAKIASSSCSSLSHDLSKGGAIDQHLTDQLIIYMALALGTSCVHTGPLTQHTLAAIKVASVMTGATFSVEKVQLKNVDEERSYLLFCEGVGLQNTSPQ